MAVRKLVSHVDRPLVAVIIAICALGLYNLASAGQALGTSLHFTQAMHMGIGTLALIVVASIDYRSYEGLAVPAFVVIVGLLLATQVVGKTVNGSKRWLEIPGLFNLQTSDIAKLGVVIIVSRILHLEGKEGRGLTLNDIFRPLNVSRPLLLVLGVVVISIAGDAIRPASLKRKVGTRSRTIARLSSSRARVVIGRNQSADVTLRYRDVASEHAEITRVDSGHYVLRDLGGNSGTYVNGDRIEGTRRVHDGDILRFGLNSRAELRLSSTIERVKKYLPWVSLLGALWLVFAIYLQFTRGPPVARDLVAPIDVVAVPCALILMQPDLGTTLVTLMIAFSIILYVGLRPLSFALLTLFSLASGIFAWFAVLKPYQKQRVLTFLNPSSDLLGSGYHQHQSLIAIGSGEILGKGHGQGTQTQLKFLPEQQTDFIFSVWAEEHGFMGCMVVVLLFAALIFLSFRIAHLAKDRFGALLVVGVTAMLFWHTLINMLMVLRLAPVVGVPLPLWSYGGSFVVTTMIGLGIVLNVGMRRFVF